MPHYIIQSAQTEQFLHTGKDITGDTITTFQRPIGVGYCVYTLLARSDDCIKERRYREASSIARRHFPHQRRSRALCCPTRRSTFWSDFTCSQAVKDNHLVWGGHPYEWRITKTATEHEYT
jgi:hypothetical protein